MFFLSNTFFRESYLMCDTIVCFTKNLIYSKLAKTLLNEAFFVKHKLYTDGQSV